MTTAGTCFSQHFAKKRVMISVLLRKEEEEKGGRKRVWQWGAGNTVEPGREVPGPRDMEGVSSDALISSLPQPKRCMCLSPFYR